MQRLWHEVTKPKHVSGMKPSLAWFPGQRSEVDGLKKEAQLRLWIFRNLKALLKILKLSVSYLYTIMASVASKQACEAEGSFHPNPFNCFSLLPPPTAIDGRHTTTTWKEQTRKTARGAISMVGFKWDETFLSLGIWVTKLQNWFSNFGPDKNWSKRNL